METIFSITVAIDVFVSFNFVHELKLSLDQIYVL